MSALASLSHVALVVRDAARTAEFFRTLFDAEVKPQDDGDGHVEVCVRIGGLWFVLAQADVERSLRGDHIAFNVTPAQLREYAAKLDALGHEYHLARNDTALYLVDFDNHVFELDTVGLDAEIVT